MAIGILGRKVGMTQVFTDAGAAVPVTVIEAGPCQVLQIRTSARDQYEAVQLGFADKPRRLAPRSERGHVAKLDSKRSRVRAAAGMEAVVKSGAEPQRFVRELRGSAGDISVGDALKVGDVLKVDVLSAIKSVDVTGTSKGRGTSGVMRRHNYSGQRASHGVKKVHRHAGSIGCSQFPGHVPKGRRMAGRYGNERVTARNLKIVKVDVENNLLLVEGAVPGPNGGYLIIRETNKKG